MGWPATDHMLSLKPDAAAPAVYALLHDGRHYTSEAKVALMCSCTEATVPCTRWCERHKTTKVWHASLRLCCAQHPGFPQIFAMLVYTSKHSTHLHSCQEVVRGL
jgi:hypothetical protein